MTRLRYTMELEEDLLAIVERFQPHLTLARLGRDAAIPQNRLRRMLDRARTRKRIRQRGEFASWLAEKPMTPAARMHVVMELREAKIIDRPTALLALSVSPAT